MPRYVPGNIPELGAQLPSGAYIGLFETFADGPDERSSTGKYCIVETLRVEEPVSHKGMPHYEHLYIGSEADPDANDPQTWESRDGKINVAAARYCEGMKKAGIEPTGDTEQDFLAAAGQRVGFIITQTVEPAMKDNQPNPYAGRVRSQISQFFRPGEREPGVYAESSVGKGKSTAAPTPKPTAPSAPAAAPTAAPAPRAVAPPAKAAPAAPPALPAKAAPTPAPRVAKKLPTSDMVKCQICGMQVPRTDKLVTEGWTDETVWAYEQRDDGVYQLGLSRHVEMCAGRTGEEE